MSRAWLTGAGGEDLRVIRMALSSAAGRAGSDGARMLVLRDEINRELRRRATEEANR